MKLFSFASRNLDNIWRGVDAGLWAVATVSESAMKGRMTKAERYLTVGSHGLLYCNPTHSFTVPFIVESRADPLAVVTDVWPEPWRLPFRIRPLGDPTRQLHMHEAQARWPFLRNTAKTGVSAAMNITGTTVFVPIDISDDEWSLILGDLAHP